MKKLGVAIIGTGWVAPEHIRAFKMSPGAEVRAIVSRSEGKGRATAEKSGLENCKVYTDYKECLKDESIDIICICTPNHLHCEQTILAAEAGKHILIEKPLAMTWEDCKRMRDAVQKAGVKTLVGFVGRFNPYMVTVKNLIKDGFLGKLFYAETDYWHKINESYPCYEWTATKEVGGSSLLAGGCHAVDAMRQFMKPEVVSVTACTTSCDKTNFEYEGTIAIIVKFADGTCGKIGSSYDFISPYIFNVRVFGNEGSLINDRIYAPHKINQQQGYMQIPVKTLDSGDVVHHNFPEQDGYFVECIINDVECESNIYDAMKTHEIIFAADASAELGKTVELPLD